MTEVDSLLLEEKEKILTNPFYCLRQISPELSVDHEVLISEEEWVKSNVNYINVAGPEKFLKNLLENLKGNFVRNE